MKAIDFLKLSCAATALLSVPAFAQTAPASDDQSAGSAASAPVESDDTPETDRTGDGKRKVRVEERDVEGEVTVTGSRFQKLLDNTQPATVISAEERNLAGVNSARELVLAQPGFNYTEDFGINVRGIGRQTNINLLGQENTVIEYVDGFLNLVPTNIAESTLFGGNVTFIRGPAGTTYGRNAIAGAINVLSRAPTKEFTGQFQGGYGRDNAFNFGANVAGPITKNIGFRLGGQKTIAPSVYKSVGGVPDAGFAVNNSYFEFQLEGRFGPFHIRNRATTFRYDNQPGYPTLSRYNNGLNGNAGNVFGALSPNPQFGFTGAVPNQPFTTNVNTAGYDKLRKNFQDIVNADLDLGFAKLVYVGGYQTYVARGQADQDLTSRTSYDGPSTANAFIGTPQGVGFFGFAPGPVPTDYRTNYYNDNYFYTHEARLEGKNGPVSWVLGYYHFKQDFDEQYWENIVNAQDSILTPLAGAGPALAAPNPRRSTFEQRNLYVIKSDAVFANVTWDISPTLQVDAGLRETWDDKHATTNFRYVYFYPPAYASDVSPAVHGATPSRSESGLSGRASVAWRPNPGDQVYASYARGYQASAFTLGQGLPCLAGSTCTKPLNIADKEFLDVYEIGGNLTRGKIRFDGSIFYQNFHNQQIPITSRGVFTNPMTGATTPGPTYTAFVNAKRTEIYGAEAQVSWHPNVQSSIVASYTYLHPTFKSFCPPSQIVGTTGCGVVDISEQAGSPLANVPQDLSGNELSRAPRHKASVYGFYGIDLGGAGHLYPGGSVYYQSSFYTQPFTVARFRVPGRAVANATLTYRTADDRLDITAVVSNIFKKRYADSSVLATFGGGNVSQAVFYGADRYWTLTGRIRF